MGVDAGAGVTNNLLGLGDIFNSRGTVVMDFTKISVAGMMMQGFAEGGLFFNVNTGPLSFGLFAGVETSGRFRASDALLRFLKEGNDQFRTLEGVLGFGGSVFLETGIRAGFPIKRLRINAGLALFSPLIYMPPPEISYRIDTSGPGGELVLSAIQMNIYSAASLEEGGFSLPDKNIPLGIPLGLDLQVEAVYSLLPKLNLGMEIDHIPILPVRLRRLMRVYADGVNYRLDEMFGFLSGGGFNLPDYPDMKTVHSEDEHFWVVRPLFVDFFVEYRPAGTGLFVIRPLIGFSLPLAPGQSQVRLSAGLEGQINIRKGFSLSLSTAYREQIWQQAVSLMFNLRVVELYTRLSLRGHDFVGSFNDKGLGVSAGLRFGY
ncbi:MAG: hypothetical protein LBQ35_02250 [Spirochaetaceae bacterium]|nr:hypothetical protein [Spirochaetaceae bacterium]